MRCSSGDTISYTPQGRAYNRFNPSLGQTMNAALLSIIYGQAIQPPAEAPTPLQVCHRFSKCADFLMSRHRCASCASLQFHVCHAASYQHHVCKTCLPASWQHFEWCNWAFKPAAQCDIKFTSCCDVVCPALEQIACYSCMQDISTHPPSSVLDVKTAGYAQRRAQRSLSAAHASRCSTICMAI